MVILVDDETSVPQRRFRIAPPVANSIGDGHGTEQQVDQRQYIGQPRRSEDTQPDRHGDARKAYGGAKHVELDGLTRATSRNSPTPTAGTSLQSFAL